MDIKVKILIKKIKGKLVEKSNIQINLKNLSHAFSLPF